MHKKRVDKTNFEPVSLGNEQIVRIMPNNLWAQLRRGGALDVRGAPRIFLRVDI